MLQDFIQLRQPKVVVGPALQVQVVGQNGQALHIDLRYQGDPSAKTLLKCLQIRFKPARLPKIGLPFEVDYARVRYLPSRQGRLPVVRGAGLRALSQFHKLAPENVIEAQLASDLLGDVEPVGPIGIDVDLLKKENISLRIVQEIYNLRQL